MVNVLDFFCCLGNYYSVYYIYGGEYMKMTMEQFQRRLMELYRSDSSKYTPFALWKMQKMIGEGEAFHDDENDCIYVIRNKQLLFYHSSDERRFHIPIDELNKLDFIVLRMCDYLRLKDKLVGFEFSQGYALYYDFNHATALPPQTRYEIAEFDFSNDRHYALAGNILNVAMGGESVDFDREDCPDWCFSPERLKRWTAFPTFDPSLWLFVRDRETQELVSFGISTYHKEAMETDLDWIFVLPEHHGRGVGRILIAEIIRRSIDRSKVIRVGGVADDFYKKCGFYEKELWGYAVKPGFSMNEQ
jgi:GNAT superfamily N-acetyltransferase